MIEEAAALFALPPAEFVADRNRLAKLLRTAGRLEDATFVAGLRRPKLSEYALNRIANVHPSIVERLVDSIGAATTAQSAAIGGEAGGLREATAELRAATKLAVDSAVRLLTDEGSNGEGQRDEVVSLIRGFLAAGDVQALRDGVVGSSAVDGSEDYFRDAPDPPERATSRANARAANAKPANATAAQTRPAKKLPPPPVGPGPADRARRIQLERQLHDAVAQVERAERNVAEAERQLGEVQQKLDDRTAVLEARRILVASAEADLDAFRHEWPSP